MVAAPGADTLDGIGKEALAWLRSASGTASPDENTTHPPATPPAPAEHAATVLLAAVAALDLAEPAAAAQAEHGWPAGRTACAVREYRRFLHLIAKT